MIVRPVQPPQGKEPKLLLIPQSVHAALSGDLASHWGRGDFLPLVHPEVVWPAIFHHDDGWIPADKHPAIDPETRRPLSFMDSPAPDSHAIWSKSIEWAGRISPLAQYLIAEHFMSLREHSQSGDSPEGEAFVHKYEALCETWRDNWEARHPATDDRQLQLAVRQLRFFDWFSLWLCLEKRTEPHLFQETPGDIDLKLTPQPGGRFPHRAMALARRRRACRRRWMADPRSRLHEHRRPAERNERLAANRVAIRASPLRWIAMRRPRPTSRARMAPWE